MRCYIDRMLTKHLSLLAVLLAAAPLSVFAQASSIVGTWVLTGADKILADGKQVSDFGPNPHGLVVFTVDGHYSVQIYRDERTKFAAGDRLKGTPEEYKEAFLSTSVHFGHYSLDSDKHTITFQIDRAIFPNWDDATQVRTYELKGDQLSWKVPPRPDGSVPITILRRVQ
jgi:hypothetical protein